MVPVRPPQQIIREGLVQVMSQTHRNFSTLESFTLAIVSSAGDTGLMQTEKILESCADIWRVAETTG